MVGIIIADYDEILLSDLKKILNLKKLKSMVFLSFCQILVKKIPLCISGIDKVNAASATTTMINYFKIDVIFNLGLCGTSKITIKITRPIVVKSIEYFDVDLTGFEYKKTKYLMKK